MPPEPGDPAQRPCDVTQTPVAPVRCDRGEPHLKVVLSQTHSPNRTMRKTSDEPGVGTFSRTPGHPPSRLPRSEKQGTPEETRGFMSRGPEMAS